MSIKCTWPASHGTCAALDSMRRQSWHGIIRPENARPTIMAIGHNFGCATYREEIGPAGREDDKSTWRNLDALLLTAGSSPARCFRTNWFIGLLPGDKQVGRFLLRPDPKYERACRSLLIKQIHFLRPTAILLLGPEVASRAYQIMPELAPWKDAGRWTSWLSAVLVTKQ